MEDKTKARYKDEIVEYLYDEYPLAIGVFDISRVVFNRGVNPEQVLSLCEDIISEGLDIIEEEANNAQKSYRANEKTGEFLLKLGGFNKQYSDKKNLEYNENLKENERRKVQDNIASLEHKNLQLSNNTFWIPIIISLVGLTVAVASYFRPSNNVLNDELNKKIERLENNQKQLENGLQKENEKLQDILYKAEMLISIYEEEK